MVTASHL